MFKIAQGDMFESGAPILVNPCNCKGVARAGVSLEFKNRWPLSFYEYRSQCEKGYLKPGNIHLFENNLMNNGPNFILNWATKDHWRNPSRYEWIERGARQIADKFGGPYAHNWGIAMPKVGCGLGLLAWDRVKAILEDIFGNSEHDVTVYYL